MQAKNCGRCKRVTSGHLNRCMFCGNVLSGDPIVRDSNREAQLENLMTQAMDTGKVSALTDMLLSDDDKGIRSKPRDERALPLLESDVLSYIPQKDELEEFVGAFKSAETGKERRWFLAKIIESCRVKLESESCEIDVGWSRGESSYSLVIDGPEDSLQESNLKSVLDLDPYKARLMSRKKGVFIAKKGVDRSSLEAYAIAYQEAIGRSAVVCSRESLLTCPEAWLVTRCISPTSFDVHLNDDWLSLDALPDIIRHQTIQTSPILAVVGEVEVQRFLRRTQSPRRRLRKGADNSILHKGSRSRLGVIDLHSKDCTLRIVEGLTDFSNLPGYVPRSSKKSIRNFAMLLSGWNPEIHSIDPKLISLSGAPKPSDEESTRVLQHAWPDWERYTRMTRTLFRVN